MVMAEPAARRPRILQTELPHHTDAECPAEMLGAPGRFGLPQPRGD